MEGFVINIEKKTDENENFREVLYTAPYSQLVVMSLEPGGDIGEEVHPDNDQFIRVEEGDGKVILNKEEKNIKDGTAIVIPAGTRHNIINTSDEAKLKLYTIYSPPHHPDGTIHETKADAEAEEMF